MDNRTIADRLLQYANYLEARQANRYRVAAYRRAADTILALDRPVAEIVTAEGRDGLEALPGIGAHLSYTLEGLVTAGEFRTQDHEGGRIDSERLFGSLPGVGRYLARQIHEQLGVETLEQLEQAAHEGKLDRLRLGRKRVQGIIDALAGRLGRRRARPLPTREPDVAELLAVDREYRESAERGALPLLTPRRFNPTLEAWLPLLETDHGGWHYRALFSNTATAHQLGRTRDWVVVYFHDGQAAGQRTVVTESRGDLQGLRVVRGRERECAEHYESLTNPPQTLPAAVAS